MRIKLKKIITSFSWVAIAILMLFIRKILLGSPEIVEQYYSRGLFVFIRKVINGISFLSPIPLIYVFIFTALFLLFRKIYLHFKKDFSVLQKLGFSLLTMLNFIGGLIISFLILWGFNYQRIPIESKLGFVPIPLQVSDLKEELDILTPQLIKARENINNSSEFSLTKKDLPVDFEVFTNDLVQQTLKELGYPMYAKANARILRPKGVLLGINTAGIYFPFVGEPNIDGGLHPITQPFILAHEFTHAYGFGDEGTCNFVAYLACLESDNPFIKYAGIMGYWRILAVNYKPYFPEKYAALRANLPKGIIADLNAINEMHNQYPEFFSEFRYMTYNAYLKAQGIDEGMKNYNRITMLARAWRLKNDTTQMLPQND